MELQKKYNEKVLCFIAFIVTVLLYVFYVLGVGSILGVMLGLSVETSTLSTFFGMLLPI